MITMSPHAGYVDATHLPLSSQTLTFAPGFSGSIQNAGPTPLPSGAQIRAAIRTVGEGF